MIVTLGVIGSIASIVGVFIAAPTTKSRFVHVIYALSITLLAAGMVSYQQQASDAEQRIAEMQKIEREAAMLLSDYDFTTIGSMSGFVLSALSFLEKHKEQLPDTYSRAVLLCENSKCLKTRNGDYDEHMNHFRDMQDISATIKYLIQGIARSES